jgi:hypothetical protein
LTFGDDWRVPVNKEYSTLVGALRARAEEQAGLCQGTIENVVVVQDSANTAWLILRLSGADSPLWLLSGHSSMRGFGDPQAGAGVDITCVPWDDRLLDAMGLLARLDQHDADYCKCGHKLKQTVRRNTRLDSAPMPWLECPACGSCDGDPAVWKEVL